VLDPEECSSWGTIIEAQVVGCQGTGNQKKNKNNFFVPSKLSFYIEGPVQIRRIIKCDEACGLHFPILESPDSITDCKSEISRLQIFAK
jgi:hypothetical protein